MLKDVAFFISYYYYFILPKIMVSHGKLADGTSRNPAELLINRRGLSI